MFFKSKAPEKDKNAAANAAEVIGRMVQQQHSVVEQVAASPPVPKCMARPCVQDGVPRSTNVRAASMYQASEVEQFAPGHHGYPRASEAD
jgi:hypothetical protein